MAASDGRRPFLEKYPVLAEKVPYLEFGLFPSPVQRLTKLEREQQCGQIWIKRDDIAATVFAGNKVRHMEFLMAQARKRNTGTMITWGALGSNQVLAALLYSNAAGFKKIIAMLRHQTANEYVRRNLRVAQKMKVKVVYERSTVPGLIKLLFAILRNYDFRKMKFPYVVPLLGSSVYSVISFINAIFELQEQINSNEIPEPDYIFVTAGSGGTLAGLELGVRLAGLNTNVIGVRAADKIFVNERIVAWEINRTLSFLKKAGLDHQIERYKPERITMLHDYFGAGYTIPTTGGHQCLRMLQRLEQIRLDDTYTAKGMCGMLDFMKREPSKKAEEKIYLFWHTLNTLDISPYMDSSGDWVFSGKLRQYLDGEP